MIKLKEQMDLSFDGVTVETCKKGKVVTLSPQLEAILIERGVAEEVRQVAITKEQSVSKKPGPKKK